jgi:hypothetical protein
MVIAFNACSQPQSTGIVVAGSSEDVKIYPEAKPNAYWKKVL